MYPEWQDPSPYAITETPDTTVHHQFIAAQYATLSLIDEGCASGDCQCSDKGFMEGLGCGWAVVYRQQQLQTTGDDDALRMLDAGRTKPPACRSQ